MNPELAINTLRQGTMLAVRLDPTLPEHEAWAGVYPLDLSEADTRAMLRRRGWVDVEDKQLFRIRVFEVLRSKIEADKWIWEGDLANREDLIVEGEAALSESLGRFGVKLQDLEFPHKSNYPI